ncbi:MAG TPA: hypothetical protein VN765_06205 [Candidatus Acidoferrum sp.]|nr:hypothetical protein [Candidatus Acidoferrum sp.]
MSAVNETIVREYFELHGFLVRQDRKFEARGRQEIDRVDFFIWHPQTLKPEKAPPFILRSADLPAVQRALVVVRGWHTESFGPGLLESSPEIFRFVEPSVFQQAARFFGPDKSPLKILIVPSLPQSEVARDQSIAILRARGVDAVIPFRTMLLDLIASTEVNRNYDKADLLQVIRVFKNYDLFKEPQMDFFRAARRARRPRPA